MNKGVRFCMLVTEKMFEDLSKDAFDILNALAKNLAQSDTKFIPIPKQVDLGAPHRKYKGINELIDRRLISKRGDGRGASYTIVVDIDAVQKKMQEAVAKRLIDSKPKREIIQLGPRIHDDTKNLMQPLTTVAEVQQLTNPTHVQPVSRGGHLPTFWILKDFVEIVEKTSKRMMMDRTDTINKEIHKLKIDLMKNNQLDMEHLTIQELGRLNSERRLMRRDIAVQAVKECAAMPQFSRYDWTNIVSVHPDDYLND